MKRRQFILETLLLAGVAFYVLNRDALPTLTLALQRGAYLTCQQAARAFGQAAIKLEASYRVKVAP